MTTTSREIVSSPVHPFTWLPNPGHERPGRSSSRLVQSRQRALRDVYGALSVLGPNDCGDHESSLRRATAIDPRCSTEIPGLLCDLIGRLHAKNPADRPDSASENSRPALHIVVGNIDSPQMRHAHRLGGNHCKEILLSTMAPRGRGAHGFVFRSWVPQ